MTPDLANNEENPRLRDLAQELCNQLAINREQTRLYKKQINELRIRTEEYNGSLYRPKLVSSFPSFDAGTDIERQNAHLICQNQSLNEENAVLAAMVKEYEQALKTIMVKFRYQAYEIHQNKLEMQRNYERLLEEQRTTVTHILSENASLQSRLSNLGSLVREAYDAQADEETDILVNSLIIENQGLRQMLRIADGTEFSTLSLEGKKEINATGQEDKIKKYIMRIKNNNNSNHNNNNNNNNNNNSNNSNNNNNINSNDQVSESVEGEKAEGEKAEEEKI